MISTSLPYTVGLSGLAGLSFAFVIIFFAQFIPAYLIFWMTRNVASWLRFGAAALTIVAASLALSFYLVSNLNPTLPIMMKSVE
jgi:hypothetical protein